MKDRNLIFLCESYPYGLGELFLNDEMNYLSEKYKTIYVLTNINQASEQRITPKNIICINYSDQNKILKLFYFLKGVFFMPLWFDLFSNIKNNSSNNFFQIFKELFVSFIHANFILKDLNNIYKAFELYNSKVTLYSYWHDSKSLAICLFNKTKEKFARAHGWDIDYTRNKIHFVPFKNYIVQKLSFTLCVSEYGRNLLLTRVSSKNENKIIVSKLGVPIRQLKLSNSNNQFIICSCSMIIPLKRVELIAELIHKLSLTIEVKWIHFGSGVLEKKIIKTSNSLGINYDFKGNLRNSEIIKFYKENHVDLFVNLSLFEGIPVSIMEAQSFGIPVLATDVGGNSEIVNNQNGFLVPEEMNIEFISSEIINYLKSDHKIKNIKRVNSYENCQLNYNSKTNFTNLVKLLTNQND